MKINRFGSKRREKRERKSLGACIRSSIGLYSISIYRFDDENKNEIVKFYIKVYFIFYFSPARALFYYIDTYVNVIVV